MDEDKRAILTEVAAGKLSPEEAAARIETLEREAGARVRPAAGGLRLVRIDAQARSVVVIGDQKVDEAVADGPHLARREADVLVIEEPIDGNLGFRFGRGPFGVAFDQQPLLVRMNPELALEADLQAGSLRVRGIHGPVKADIQAGYARLEDIAAPIKLRVQAGSVRVSGRLDGGESLVRCEAGSVRVELDGGSNVRVKARSGLGKVDLPGGGSEWVAGSGAGSLALEVGMGKIQVSDR
jgi:hypothetical protein